MSTTKVFSGTSNRKLTEKICRRLELPLGEVAISTQSSGEIHVTYQESIRNCDVFIVQALSEPINEKLVELLVLIDAAKRGSARTVNLVIPYYGYARQERKSAPREPISAKMVADILTTVGANRVITIDLHADPIEGFFKIPVDHLTALGLIIKYLKTKKIENPVVVSPDAGRATTAEQLALLLNCPFAIMIKNRPEHNKAEITHIIGDVAGMTPIIIEDLIDTGGTIVNVVNTLKNNGANDAYVCATHAVFSDNAMQRLDHPNIEEVVVTDTIEWLEAPERFVELSVSDLIAESIRIITKGGSINTLLHARV